eukprot:7765899-Pyramimonas_sp.AAC.1
MAVATMLPLRETKAQRTQLLTRPLLEMTACWQAAKLATPTTGRRTPPTITCFFSNGLIAQNAVRAPFESRGTVTGQLLQLGGAQL